MTSWRLVSDVPRATNNPPTHCLNTPKGNHTPQRTGNTTDDLSLSHMHVQKGGLPINILFFDHIMEADIPLGWKPLNLEQYDGTTNLHEHLDAFLTQVRDLHTPDGQSHHDSGGSFQPRGYQTITKQEQCSEDIKRSSTGTRKQTEDRKTEADKDTSNSGVSDNLHQNKNPPQHVRDRDFKGINLVNLDNPVAVSIIIANFMVSKFLID
ncbi:hypothetical protein JHK87_009664 [Glycine soja]|nr:hypothetical protein JHK87_009664 [Glycine soja]